MDTTLSDPRVSLRRAAKRATMPHNKFADQRMKHAKKITVPAAKPYDIFDDFGALTLLVQESFNEAAKAAGEENDRLGIETHGSIDGKLVVRHPPKSAATPTNT